MAEGKKGKNGKRKKRKREEKRARRNRGGMNVKRERERRERDFRIIYYIFLESSSFLMTSFLTLPFSFTSMRTQMHEAALVILGTFLVNKCTPMLCIFFL